MNMHFLKARCILLVYDVTRESTFTRLDWWLETARNKARGSLKWWLVGNLAGEGVREVQSERGMEWARENNFDRFMEVSSLTGFNLGDTGGLIEDLGRDLYALKNNLYT